MNNEIFGRFSATEYLKSHPPKVKFRKVMQHPEYDLQVRICKYVKLKYPNLNFKSDTSSFIKLTAPQAIRNKNVQTEKFAAPDITIYKPKGVYHGLFIELKILSPFKLDGNLQKNEHLEAQQKSISELCADGYKACFSWGYDMTINIIDNYMQKGI